MLFKKEIELVRPLDIWGIIQKYIDTNSDWAIDKCELQLNITRDVETFVDVHYYDSSRVLEEKDVLEQEPTVKRFKPSIDSINKMYSDISQLVDLPRGVVGLHTVLDDKHEVYFNLRFVTFKNKE